MSSDQATTISQLREISRQAAAQSPGQNPEPPHPHPAAQNPAQTQFYPQGAGTQMPQMQPQGQMPQPQMQPPGQVPQPQPQAQAHMQQQQMPQPQPQTQTQAPVQAQQPQPQHHAQAQAHAQPQGAAGNAQAGPAPFQQQAQGFLSDVLGDLAADSSVATGASMAPRSARCFGVSTLAIVALCVLAVSVLPVEQVLGKYLPLSRIPGSGHVLKAALTTAAVAAAAAFQ